MDKNNNLFYASLVFGFFYSPFAILFYLLSKKPLTYESNRLYKFLIFLRHGNWYEERLNKSVEYLNIGEDTCVLEVGCGVGDFSKKLLRVGANLKAIDINEQFICKLQKCYSKTFELCSVTNLKYKDDSFDRAVMFDVLHHIPNYEKALEEVSRVLKPGGYAIIWEGSEPAGEEHLPSRLSKFLLEVFDGKTNPADFDKLKKEFKIEELEPYCYKLSK